MRPRPSRGPPAAHAAARARARQLKGRGGDAGADKRALWRELAAAGFARAAAAAWLLPLLDLLLRVQLNILGRHLFLESNLLDPRHSPPRPLVTQKPPPRTACAAGSLPGRNICLFMES
jgi:hypothetical protein